MDRKNRSLARLTILVGIVLLILVVVGIVVTNRKVVSPVPEDTGIKIIILSPTPSLPSSEPQGIGGSEGTVTPKP